MKNLKPKTDSTGLATERAALATLPQIDAGQAAFTKPALALYDQLVLGATCHLVWRCSTDQILGWYRQHLSGNHLEVGVGTGLFLDRVQFPVLNPRLALLDLNPNCLERTAARLARYRPEVYRANVLQPIPVRAAVFDSVALNYVLHCLPGKFPEKGIVFGHLKQLLKPGGVIFGATVLHGGVDNSSLAKGVMRLLNARRVFSNREDHLDSLVSALEQELGCVRVEVSGSVALFCGRART